MLKRLRLSLEVHLYIERESYVTPIVGHHHKQYTSFEFFYTEIMTTPCCTGRAPWTLSVT